MTQTQKLERIRNRHTLYEIAGKTTDGFVFLIMYSGKSLSQIARGIHSRYDMLSSRMGDRISIAKDVESRGPGCVWITGRTQREAIIAGELPYIGA